MMGKRIGLIGAMDEEIRQLRSELQMESTEERAGITFYIGEINGSSVVLCRSGVGKVNAAVTTQILIDAFEVSHILFTGIAGALDKSLQVGDMVISSSAMQHDMDATALGFPKGQIPMQSTSSIFQADSGLVELAFRSAERILSCRILKGRILSGDQFIADLHTAQTLYDEFTGACVEMEGAAVAQVATMSEIPFVIIRAISDNANEQASMSFTEFTELASKQSHILVMEMLSSWNDYNKI
ncbi:5'-methylthioadenosine/adenosylhomocysteine nucleosidase [Alkalicoccobacillus porphyridii]|uniref:adenosylhomocysteine nucleosidase n=2 Tax=Alkalicoccobacillus porphyridii TaxID=2597270 RepID=A0A554A365_9BACI|nr:5'-methylthioadenosine/adenosylhomocysteine nucleosidase [Alkalicoccobacillus porphyridii]